MSVLDRQVLAQFFSREGNFDDVSIEDQRARFDALADLFPQTGDVFSAERAKVGGVDGEWVRTRASLPDAALLYLHGGGYSIGSAKSHRHMIGALVSESAVPAFAADYRLAPENRFPAALDDAVAAYRGLVESGIAASRIAIAGDSAGGGLAIATLVAAKAKGLPMPACAVAISPWCDLSQGGESYRARAKRDPIVSKDSLDSLASAYLGNADPKTPLASPLYADLAGLPPLLIQVGTEEALYGDAAALKARAEEAGVEVSWESWGGMIHVWHLFHPILSEGRDAIARAGRFLRARIA